MVVSFISIALNAFVNWLFAFKFGWGIRGLALGTGCVAVAQFLMLYLLMRREAALSTRELAAALGKLTLASAALGAVCWAAQTWLFGGWAGWGVGLKAGTLLGTIAAAGAVYFLVALLLRIPELDEVVALLKRKLGRFRKRG